MSQNGDDHLEGAERDWREMLDVIGELLRDRDRARADLKAGRVYMASLRDRLRTAEDAVAAYDARERVRGRLAVDPARLGAVEIFFGMFEADAVRVPPGGGNAAFLYGLVEIVLTDDRPIYIRLVRAPAAN